MGGENRDTPTIGELIEQGVIVAHKDGNHGSSYPRGHEFGDDGVLFLTAKLVSDSGRIDFQNAPRLNFEKAKKITFGYLEEGDVLLSHNATVGRVALVPELHEKALIGTSLTHFRLDSSRLLPKYLAAYFKGRDFQNQLSAMMGGMSTRNQVPITAQRQLRVVVPPIGEQQSIAHILGTLDDKIELNRQMNSILEAMAQALFKSWFVDFDPVIDNALAAGNPIPEPLQARAEMRKGLGEQRKPLSAEIQRQFPSRFVFTEEMGWVPEGWVVHTLESITTELRRGISPKYTDEGGIQVVNQKCIRNHLINYALCRRNDEEKKAAIGRELQVGDVLINSTGVGTLGRMAQVLYLDERTVADSHVTVVRANQNAFKPYTLARALLNIEPYIEAMGEGSTGQTELSRANLQSISVLVPTLCCQNYAESFFLDWADKVVTNTKQVDSLTNLRDTLLPKLLSGQLRIPEAEAIIERAGVAV